VAVSNTPEPNVRRVHGIIARWP